MAKVSKEDAVQWYAQNRGLYKKLSIKIQNIISELLEEANLTIHTITNRTKEIDSLKKKLDNPKYNDPLNQITDFSGIRVIAYVEADLKPICEIIENSFHIDYHNSTDKSDDLGTDKVGYKSIHYVAKILDDRLSLPEYKKFKDLRFEVQIRTILQHAWAEIEHDRNYKFNGVLSPEITRRFKILSGTLELVDREFNELSKRIDEISQSVVIADQKNELNSIVLNSTTIKEFLSKRFSNLIKRKILSPDLSSDIIVIRELKNFGINTLKDLDKIITSKFLEKYETLIGAIGLTNYLGLLRDIMIINDYKKYFEKSWKRSWTAIDNESKKLYEGFGLDVNKLSQEYGLDPED